MELTVQEAFALAARHEAAGRTAEARSIYDQILAALPEHPGALLKLALQEHALPVEEIWLALARVRLARGERDSAVAALEQVHGVAVELKAAGASAAARALLEQCVALT